MSKFFKIYVLFAFLIIIPQLFFAQNIDSLKLLTDTTSIDTTGILPQDTTNISVDNFAFDTIPRNDSLALDSVFTNDTLALDSIIPKDNAITDIIDFSANDSMHIAVADKQIILFGNGHLNTIGMEIIADSVGIDMDKKELDAKGLPDSTGRIVGKPVFKDVDQEYTCTRMRYNFDTKKGITYEVMTQQQDGFLHGQVVKIQNQNEMHILNGKYTTCDHPHPHYYIDLTKAKLLSKDKIITGPLYFVILDIPVPIWAPFGFFPLSQKNSSGVHLPTFKSELKRGFGLLGTGYFWAVNDYFDIDVTGDIYSKGSWGLNVKTNYKKRYFGTANANISFLHYQDGEKILKTTTTNNSFSAKISFVQDPKARPSSSFSANINYVYGNIQQYNANDINQFVNTNTNSSISYQKTFKGTPFSMSSNFNLSQNLSDNTSNLRFPVVNFRSSKYFLFKPKNKPAKGAWYEKIGLSFNSQFTNSVTAADSVFLLHQDSLFRMMKSGFKYDVPLQTSFTALKYFTISPSFNYHGRIYPYKIQKQLAGQPDSLYTVNDTTWGFNHVYDFDTRISMSTRIFGLFKLNIGRLKAIRHVISPSLSYVYKPDFGNKVWGYYEYNPMDSSRLYSLYETSVYGTPQYGEQQRLSLSIGNNFEAKISPGKDTTKQEKKLKLLDNLSMSASYNFAADSLNLSKISFSGSLKPLPKINMGFSGVFDPYAVDANGKSINQFEFVVNRKLARLTTANLSLNTSFGSKDFRKANSSIQGLDWSTTVSYNFRFSKVYNLDNQEFDIDLSQTARTNFTITPTPLWRIGVTSGYDFDASKVTSTTLNIYRNLHCWEMSLQVTPFGKMKGFQFKINIKASMFDMIKFEKQRSWHDNL